MGADARLIALSPELTKELEIIADQRQRPIGEVLEDVVRRFLDHEAAIAAKVKAAQANAAAGNTVTWDEAEQGFRETIARAAGRRAAS